MQNTTTIGLISATFFIALTHAVMPNHWMPFVLIGRGQKWSLTKTIFITSIAGLGHSVATCILGSIIALIGLRISKYAETVAEPIAACILIVLGIVFVVFGRLRPCKHDHNHTKFSDKAIVISLFMMLSCSPCVAVLPIFLAASTISWSSLFLLSVILSITTVSSMVGLTILAYNGVRKINLCAIEHYEREIIGGILSTIGIIFLIAH